MTYVPKINRVYWACIALAGIFGANFGDFLSDGLGLGNVRGLPFEALALAAVYIAQRFLPSSALYFWIAVVIVRAAATNVGDALHTIDIGWPIAVPASAALLALCVAVWRLVSRPEPGTGFIPVNAFYWVSLFLAGIFDTVAGDATSYGLHLGNLWATVAFGLPVAALLLVGRNGLITTLAYYWVVVGLIRSAGTAAGDDLAHHLGLDASTAISGVIFLGLIVTAYAMSHANVRTTGRSPERPGRPQLVLPEAEL